MNDERIDMDDRSADEAPFVGATAATVVPVVAEADGKFVSATDDGDVSEGEIISYVQTDEDA